MRVESGGRLVSIHSACSGQLADLLFIIILVSLSLNDVYDGVLDDHYDVLLSEEVSVVDRQVLAGPRWGWTAHLHACFTTLQENGLCGSCGHG